MYIVVESPVEAIRADFRRVNRGSALQRMWHAIATQRQRAKDRATARGIGRLEHPGVVADYGAARRGR